MKRNLTPYFPSQPDRSNLQNSTAWFNDPNSFEMPNQTRRYDDYFIGGALQDVLKYFSLRKEELEQNIEKCIAFRSLPGFKKEITGRSKMAVGAVSSQFWHWWISEKKKSCIAQYDTKKKFKLPNHIGRKEHHHKHYVGWLGPSLPALQTPYWWFIKWCDLDGVLYRCQITNITFVRNSWTGQVTVEYIYNLWIWNDDSKIWQFL